MFMAANACPILLRAIGEAERAGFEVPRLLERTTHRRGFADADDPAVALTWRLVHAWRAPPQPSRPPDQSLRLPEPAGLRAV
ncbi:hypothetical protein AR457_36475 [Streptomyces agglomeratus]|uniref:Uncharacterized protein n=1 Tax=Streptomyces agglomeratus TaxID=285458 RepID=A0A1E5NYD5_9ACTN|nr:hypothetical protein [Streptomyces agglomeratus]OEJ21333.1 hypothetical protein AS594_37695 [Streptomyces agglomeratus]OEJ22767.1 hypothetical protein AR457_36475 [Streptomyces agglomeratus]OEJ36711.1 hypothetical protein BGK72_36840 [Streptomyces agglomeratus]OEJ56437.1 hypothetical protein BGM19_37780 [Streptomyces agglomeratus]